MALQETGHEAVLHFPEKSEILSDEQIEQLLQNAEARLKHASELSAHAAEAPEVQDVIAVGSVGKRKPYVCTNDRKWAGNNFLEDSQSLVMV
jgi:molecular chaperone DnaK (HSP70)